MKLYRGFNNNYSETLGVRPEQKGVWMTEDYEYAKQNAEMFKNGAIAEIEINDNSNIANEYDCMNVFDDEPDMADYICDLGGDIEFDNQVCNKLTKSGYDGVMFDDSGVDNYYIFNRNIIKGYKIIKIMKNDREDAMESLCEGLGNKPVSFTAYHGGVEPDMTPDEGRAFYLTDDYDLAHQFARREVDDGLYEGEIPTIFTYKGTFNNPYYLTDDEYDSEGQDSNIDYKKWVEMGVDGLVYEGQGGSTYYIVIDLSTIKLVDKKVYWEEEIKDDELDESKQHNLSDKSNMADCLRCLQIWADHNEGMEAIDIIPPARAWEGLSDKQKKDIIKQHDGAFEYWDGDTTADWVANELKKNGFSSDYDSKFCDDFRKILNEDINSDLFNVLLESNILTEDIEAVKKYFPKVPEEKIQTLVELDPTYQGGDNLGKFGKWILGLYNKGQLKDEDFYKVPQYLTTFKDNIKKIQNKDIMSYKTLPDLAKAIQPYEGQKDISKKQQVKQLKSDEAEKVLETSKWLIVHPKTHKADCYYGANTKWCTASKDDDTWFNNYNEKGPLFIIINKRNPNEKYQFHFESLSFMDELDKPIAPSDVLNGDDKATQWFISYCQENLPKIIEKYNEDAYNEIYDNGSYSISISINSAIDRVLYTNEKTLFDTEELASWYDESKTAFEFWNGTIRNYLKDNPEFHEECEEAVIEFTDENAFISDIHNFLKEGDLYGNKEFQQILYRRLSDEFAENYAEKIEKIWDENFGNYDIDGGNFYIQISEDDIITEIFECGDIDNDSFIPYVDNTEDYYNIDKEFQSIMEKTIIQTIKDWTKSENQLEFKFDESVKNWKNPFLED